MAWRKANNIDAMLTSYQEPEVMAKYWPGGICGRDKEGRPVQIDRFGAIDLKGYSIIFIETKRFVYRSCKQIGVFGRLLCRSSKSGHFESNGLSI